MQQINYFVLKPIAIAILKAQKKHNIVSTLKEFGSSGKATDYCISYECGEKYASNLVDTRYIHPRYFISLHVVHAGKVSHFNDDLSSDDIELRQFVGRNYVTNDGGPPSFSELLKLYMSEKCVTVEQLAESSGLDPKTIQRYRNDPNIRPALNSVIAICLGLHLLPTDSIALIHSAGYTLRNIERERAYLFVINTCYDQSIHICNELLKRNGFDPII